MNGPEEQAFNAADLYDAFPEKLTVSPLQFRSFGQRATFWGRAETLRTFEDHTPVLETVSLPGSGKVLVVDAGGSFRVGVMGDRLAGIAAENDWAGIVINGAIRDSRGMAALDIGIKALGTTARRGWTATEGVRGETLDFGEITVTPGDWVYCDQDAFMISRERLDPDTRALQTSTPVTLR